MSTNTTKWNFYVSNIQAPYPTKELTINNKYIHEFFFIESIENMFLTAELAIDDKYGFFEAISLSGKEIIKVVIEQELLDPNLDMIKTIEFEIFNITIEIPNINTNIHRFYLIEKGASKLFGSNYCVGFTNEKISNIMKSVMENQLGIKPVDYEVESTKDKIDYIIPYIKPTETITNLIKKSRREKIPHEGGFLFFSTIGNEDRTKPIRKFVSLSSLIKKDKLKTDTDYDKYSFRKQDSNQYFINTFKEVKNPDYCNQAIKSNGIGGKHYFGINYNNDKNVINVSQKYSDFINKTTLMGKTAFFDKGIDNINDEIEFFGGQEETLKARQDYSMRFLICNYNVRKVILEGALFRHAGKLIFVEQMSLNKEDVHNTQDYGYWLIKSITHYYSMGSYTQKMTIVKDSYGEGKVKLNV
jgi:hypothetical protein